jgi:hypothetical protein
VVADLADATAANEHTIVNLKGRNLQLEKEHRDMSQMVKQKFTTGRELERVMKANSAGNDEAQRLRKAEKHLREQNEELLDSLQQLSGHITAHQKNEHDSRSEAIRLRSEVDTLKDTIAQQKIQIRE